MLYTKPINQITWADVEQFCQQEIKESTILEYKQDFPKKLEKILAAMANTLGGLILIGVKETEESKPDMNLLGIPFEKGLEERVFNIIVSNIIPYFAPEVNVCRNEIGDRAIVVIRVPQSNQSPHAIESNTQVYIRTGNIASPEELAKIDRIDWLKDNREKAITHKNNLRVQSDNRYISFCDRLISNYHNDGKLFQNKTKGILTISTIPTYPSNCLRNPSELRELVNNIKVKDIYGSFPYFPCKDILSDHGNGLLTQDSTVFINSMDETRIFFTEVNSFGQVFFRQTLKRKQGGYKQPEVLYCSEIIGRIASFIGFVSLFYEEVGYWGYLDFNITLSHVKDQYLWLDWYKSVLNNDRYGISPDNEVSYFSTVSSSFLNREKDSLLFEGIQKLAWAFDIDFTNQDLLSFNKNYK